MIVSTRDGELLLVRQTDHAALSGELAAAWGNDRFAPPEPADPVVLAAALHDNGWQEWEAAPRLDPRTGRPYQFYDLPPEEHLALYQRGVDRVVARDRYAGLLVNLHCSGLYRGRYGIDAGLPVRQFPPDEQAIVDQALARLDEQNRRLREELAASVPAPHLRDERVWANYKLLQVYDRLSLFLCMLPLRERGLGPAPAGHGDETELTLRPGSGSAVVIDPYPFGPAPLHARVSCRRVPDRGYADDAEFQRALAAADTHFLSWELTPP